MSGFLSKKERKDLLYELSLEKNLKYAKRIMTILHLDKGKLCVTAHSRKFLFKAIEMASKEEYPLFLIVLT